MARASRPSAGREKRGQDARTTAGETPALRRWAAIALAGLALMALVAGALWFRYIGPDSKVAGPPMRIVPLTSFPGHQNYARFSPDGKQIAFAWDGEKGDNWDIYVKLIGTEKPLRLTTDAGEDNFPAWSPDGRYIAFCRYNSKNEGGIYVVPALGGAEHRLPTPSLSWYDWAEFLDWSPDGKYLVYVDKHTWTLFLVGADNPDDKRQLTTSTGQAELNPRFSPDGKTVAFLRSAEGLGRDIFLVRTAGGEPKPLTFDNVIIRGLDWTPDGAYIVFSSDRLSGQGRLWKVAASGGQPEPLPVGQGGAYFPSLSRDGRRLAYTQADANTNIWRYEVPRTTGRSAPPTKLIASTGGNIDPQYSPDGKRIVFVSSRAGSREIWVCDSDGSNPRQLTSFGGAHVGVPVWSPDGREILFYATPEGRAGMYVVSEEGGQPRNVKDMVSWSRDGKWIYFTSDRTGALQVWKRPAEGGEAVQVTKQGGAGYRPFESPDGKSVYYEKFEGEASALWKVPAEGGEETRVLEQVVEEGWLSWGLTTEGIYFYDASTKAIEFFSFATHKTARIAKLESPPSTGFAVSPDGRWILNAQLDQDTSNIMLVENFRW